MTEGPCALAGDDANSGSGGIAGTAGIGGVRVVHLTVLGGPLAITTATVSALVADL